jgi:hypothetical protein
MRRGRGERVARLDGESAEAAHRSRDSHRARVARCWRTRCARATVEAEGARSRARRRREPLRLSVSRSGERPAG